MTINIDPDRQHAVFAPSSADRWIPCTASAEGIEALPPEEEGEEAVKGTAAHEELERVLRGGTLDLYHVSAFGVALAVDYVAKLPPGEMWIEQRVALTNQIWGRCDVAHWDPVGSVLTIVDLKDGHVGVDAKKNPQVRIYAAGSMFTHKLPVKWLRYAIVQPNDFRPVPRVKQWFEPVADLYAWAERVALIPSGPKTFVAGEQCTYCPLFGMCPPSRDILRDVGALVAGLMQPEQVTPAQRALFLDCAKPIADAFKKAEKAWLKDQLAGKGSADLKVVESQKHRAWLDEAAAKAFIIKRLGVEALDLPTPAQAIERGIPEKEIHAMAPRPPGGPVLAAMNDSRPEFKKQSATQMFAGVAKKVAK